VMGLMHDRHRAVRIAEHEDVVSLCPAVVGIWIT
jgi:hypothetical protein